MSFFSCRSFFSHPNGFFPRRIGVKTITAEGRTQGKEETRTKDYANDLRSEASRGKGRDFAARLREGLCVEVRPPERHYPPAAERSFSREGVYFFFYKCRGTHKLQ